MNRMIIAAAMAVCMPVAANAFTINAINDTNDAHAAVDVTDSLVIPGVFTNAPTTVASGVSIAGVARSPFENDDESIDFVSLPAYYSVGVDGSYYPNGTSATLDLGGLATEFSLLWGSPDSYNTLELLLDDVTVLTVIGDLFFIPEFGASFVSIAAEGSAELFNGVRFSSAGNAFEFSSVSLTPIPLPPSLLLLLGALAALGFGSRYKKVTA